MEELRWFIGIFLATSLACRPVLTIGWGEIGILIVIIAVLLGPVIFRLAKRLGEFQAWKNSRGNQKETEEN